jgi:hypothetical protein
MYMSHLCDVCLSTFPFCFIATSEANKTVSLGISLASYVVCDAGYLVNSLAGCLLDVVLYSSTSVAFVSHLLTLTEAWSDRKRPSRY